MCNLSGRRKNMPEEQKELKELKVTLEEFIRRYLEDKFALFKWGMKYSLLARNSSEKYWAIRIIAIRDAMKEMGLWEKFYRENKEDIDKVADYFYEIEEYWIKGVPEDHHKYYMRVKETIKNDLIFL